MIIHLYRDGIPRASRYPKNLVGYGEIASYARNDIGQRYTTSILALVDTKRFGEIASFAADELVVSPGCSGWGAKRFEECLKTISRIRWLTIILATG